MNTAIFDAVANMNGCPVCRQQLERDNEKGLTMKTITPKAEAARREQLIPNREYARRIGVTPRTLYNYEQRGIVPPATIINGRKFRDPDVLPRGDAPQPPRSSHV